MKKFDNTRLWEFLQAAGNTTTALTVGLDTVFDNFLSEVHDYCREEKNIAERTRSLTYARSELTAYASCPQFDSKKHAPIRMLVKLATDCIDGELGLIGRELEYPDRFIVFPEDHPPLARWNGPATELVEYFTPPHLAGRLLKPSGEVMNYTDTIELIEKVFGIKVNKPYDTKTRLLMRKKTNTPFLDKMRQLFREEGEKLDK